MRSEGVVPYLWSLARGAAALYLCWAERARTRRALEALDDAQLRDIGLTRHQARREAERPFWD